MQGLLLGCKGDRYGFRLAHGEVADVAAAGTVDQPGEGVEMFEVVEDYVFPFLC